MSDPHPQSRTSRLDAAMVLASLFLLGFVLYVLAFVKIPTENLAVLAGISSGLTGTVIGGYAGYRWASSQSGKTPGQPGTATALIEATAKTEGPE